MEEKGGSPNNVEESFQFFTKNWIMAVNRGLCQEIKGLPKSFYGL